MTLSTKSNRPRFIPQRKSGYTRDPNQNEGFSRQKYSLHSISLPVLSRVTLDRTEGGEMEMFLSIHQSILALIAGVLILAIPRLLSYIVAIYLIIIGILGLIR
jgi:hypothetical protein